METTELGPFEYADKIPLKRDYQAAGVRVVPGASARWGCHLAPGVVMMPSYVNIGAYVGENTMVDTWATVGSCAQIGKNVHLSGGVGIGGVLEPANAVPVVIGDECMHRQPLHRRRGRPRRRGDGARGRVHPHRSIPVIDAETGEEISRGRVPSWCVAVSATRPKSFPGASSGCRACWSSSASSQGERHDKSKLNDILRDHGATV